MVGVGPVGKDVFISAASQDRALAQQACNALEADGVECWIAPRDVTPGSDYPTEIVKAINGARLMLVVFSAAAASSKHVSRELERAVSKGVPILPLRIEDITPEGPFEYFLASAQWLDVFQERLDRQLPALVEAVRVLLGRAESGEGGSPQDADASGLLAACRGGAEPANAREAMEPDTGVPAGLASPTALSFVGRTAQLAELEKAWRAAGDHGVVVAAVVGEPGIGKTRILGEFARQVAATGAAVLYGRAEEDLGMPYAPFVEALDGYIRATPGERLAIEVGPLGGELTRLVPLLADRVSGLERPLQVEPETERFRLFAAVAELLTAIAATRPTLVVLDDLQWATTADVLLIGHLVRMHATGPILVVTAYRDTEVGPGHPLTPLLGELPRLAPMSWIHLAGLRPDDVEELIRAKGLADGETQRLASAVCDETGGNPFFVSEVLRHLAELGPDRSDGWDLSELGVPEGVREVVGRRLGRLPEGTERILTLAAVIGTRFDLPLLLALTDDDVATLECLAAAEAAAVVAPDATRPGSYRFGHIVHATLYDRLPWARRIALHREVGHALERLPGAQVRLAELARHFAAAAPLGDLDRALEYAMRAGDAARAALDFEQSADLYRSAIALADQLPTDSLELRCDLQTALGDVLHRVGDPDFRTALFAAAAAARQLGDARRLAHAALAMNLAGEFPAIGEVDNEFVALLTEALDVLGDDDMRLKSRLLSLLALQLMFSNDQARRLASSEEAIRLARELDDPPTLARVLISTHWGGATADNVSDRLAVADELVGLGEQLGDPETQCWGYLFRFEDGISGADLETAEQALSKAEEFAEQLRQPAFRYEVLYRRASVALLAGKLDEAEQLIFSALDVGVATAGTAPLAVNVFAVQLGRLRFDQGRTGEILEAGEMALAQQHDIALSWHAALALFYNECGDDEKARAHFEEAAGADFVGMGDHAWIEGVALACLVAPRLGDHARTETLYERLLPYAGRVNYPRLFVEEPVDYHLGVLATSLGRYEAAERHLAVAESLATRMRASTSLARIRLQRAVMLHARGSARDAEPAARLAHTALESAEQLGMRRVAEQARQLLDQLSSLDARSIPA